jgi:hypothetical protein
VGDLTLDNDGALEVVINNLDARPSLLKNFATKKNWLSIQLVECSGVFPGSKANQILTLKQATGAPATTPASKSPKLQSSIRDRTPSAP